MFPTLRSNRTVDDVQTLKLSLQTALGQQNDLLSALNKACAFGKELPISISESIDIILDVIPRTEARIRELASLAAHSSRRGGGHSASA